MTVQPGEAILLPGRRRQEPPTRVIVLSVQGSRVRVLYADGSTSVFQIEPERLLQLREDAPK